MAESIGKNIIKILYISLTAPFDERKVAGSKVHNYFVKQLNSVDEYDLKLITFAHNYEDYELAKSDHKKHNIDSVIIEKHNESSIKINIVNRAMNKISPFDKNGNFTSDYYRVNIVAQLEKMKSEGYAPDVILIEWTQVILFIDDYRRVFQNAKYIVIEQDISYQGLIRKYKREKNILKKLIKNSQYKHLKNSELAALKKCDIIFTLNYKDRNILLNDGISSSKIYYLSPWFQNFNYIHRQEQKKKEYVFFLGAMNRPENYISMIEFCKNVMVDEKDLKLYIVGGNPDISLKAMESEKIVVTGFVDNVDIFYEDALAFVAPLLLGAGIKIKILEAMSSGIPVLTNDIGIEGIPAIPGKHYIKCDSYEDYNKAFELLKANSHCFEEIGRNAKKLIQDYFSPEASIAKIKKIINTELSVEKK